MQRGIMVLVLQMLICMGVTGLGVWALAQPRRLQLFMNENFYLLPAVKPDGSITPMLIRVFGVFLLWYAYSLLREYHKELVWIGRLFGITS